MPDNITLLIIFSYLLRAQKDRAIRSEDTVEKMNSQLLELETHMADNQLAMDQMKSKQDKMSREKVQVEGENAALSRLEFQEYFV